MPDEIGVSYVWVGVAYRVELLGASAQESSDPQIRGFYRFLADWEGSHLRMLEKLYDSIRVDPWPEKD